MKLAITGALGHIGSKLTRDLPHAFPGLDFTLLDDLSAQRYCSLFNLPSNARYRFIEADVTQADLASAFQGADAVIHLAAITNAAGSFDIREKVENTNFTATSKVAYACASLEIPMLYLSTTSVYGTQASVVDENCSADELKPQSPYAETKLKEEAYLSALAASHGLRHITCRFGTIFGVSPGMRFHTAVNKFCWQAVTGTPVTVWRTAMDQVRPYLDLQDAVRAISFILSKRLFDGQTYNVLTLNTSVATILATIRKTVPALKVSLVDTAIMNQLSYNVACDKFRALGFEFRGDLERGVSETLQLLGGGGRQPPIGL